MLFLIRYLHKLFFKQHIQHISYSPIYTAKVLYGLADYGYINWNNPHYEFTVKFLEYANLVMKNGHLSLKEVRLMGRRYNAVSLMLNCQHRVRKDSTICIIGLLTMLFSYIFIGSKLLLLLLLLGYAILLVGVVWLIGTTVKLVSPNICSSWQHLNNFTALFLTYNKHIIEWHQFCITAIRLRKFKGLFQEFSKHYISNN